MPTKLNRRQRTGRVRLTVELSEAAYQALAQLQQKHRLEEGRVLPKWQLLDEAVMSYAQTKGIQIHV